MANQGGFATARQAHDAKDFTGPDLHARIGDTYHAAVLLQNLLFGQAVGFDIGKRVCSLVAENLPDIGNLYGVSTFAHGIRPIRTFRCQSLGETGAAPSRHRFLVCQDATFTDRASCRPGPSWP